MTLKKLWGNFLDYIFPRECFGCQTEGEYLCSACFSQIELLASSECFFCHQPALSAKNICPACSEASGLDRILAATHYSKTLTGRLVEALKFNYIESLAGILADIIWRLDLRLPAHVVLQPIPLHPQRLAERGFNQSSLIASQLSQKSGWPVVDLLFRQKNTGQQAKLDKKARLVNIKEAFAVRSGVAIPRYVALVDDVFTSGATMAEAAKVLKQAGVQEVIGLVVCHG